MPFGLHSLILTQSDLAGSLLPCEFTLYAPSAKEVFLFGDMTHWQDGKVPMTRGEDGVWHLKLQLRRGQWHYKFDVDTRRIPDPLNPLVAEDGMGMGECHSYLFLGEGDWLDKPKVPRGELLDLNIPCSKLGGTLPGQLYLPPGTREKDKLPLLVLMHGHQMRANQWATNGRIKQYMDNLLAQGLLRPFAVYLPGGHAGHAMPKYAEAVVQTALPWLAKQQPVTNDPAQRAIGGMSISEHGPLAIALAHPKAFSLVVPMNETFSDAVIAGQLDKQPFRLHLFCTTEGCAPPQYRQLMERSRSLGITVPFMRLDGVPTWRNWNEMTPEFLATVSDHFHRQQQKKLS
ncbi:alpha/beta hydrolase-fold protein [Niveibacterium sp.]|uniref:alpha/beta hydrolase-fold protein n=1 Tax=Niveibacterium sp. TaxID=2017444 RepID=UPI0035B2DC8A